MMEPWIGLAHVIPRPGNGILYGANGAFVPTMALAHDVNEFVARVKGKLGSYEFDINEIEDIEPLQQRFRDGIPQDVGELAATLSEENAVVFLEFHSY